MRRASALAVVAVLAFPLIGLGQLPPVAPDVDLGDVLAGTFVEHTFTTTSGTPPFVWQNLSVVVGSPAVAPTLSSDGAFQWATIGSGLGPYAFDVTVINDFGSDSARLSLNLVIPEPSSAALAALALAGWLTTRPRRSAP